MRQMCSIPSGEPLPEKLADKYWAHRYCADRISHGLDNSDLIGICVACGFGKPTAKESAGPTVVELWKSKKLSAETPVLVEWRGKKVAGKLMRVTASNQCGVLLPNDPQEKLVNVECVTLPKA